MQSSKFQAPTSRERPSSKHQTATRCSFWCLVFGISLELGCWNLELHAIAFICFGVSSQASVAHFPTRSVSASSLPSPPFLKSSCNCKPPVTSREISRLKSGSCPTSKTFSGAGFTRPNCRHKTAASPPGASALENFKRFFNFNSAATISAVCFARRSGLERMRSKRKSIIFIAAEILRSCRRPFGVSGRAESFSNPVVPRSTATP